MKRIVAAVLMVVMSLGIFGTCLADDVDLSSISIDKLIELRNAITSELKDRLAFEDNKISEGVYVVGKDIKTGRFVFTLTRKFSEEYYDHARVKLYLNEDKYNNDEQIHNDGNTGYLDDGDSMTLNLEEGMVLVIYDGEGVIEETASPSWAP